MSAAACSPATKAADPASEQGLTALTDPRTIRPAGEPEWERNITHTKGATLPPTAFRAGGGLAAAVFGPSQFTWKFILARRGHPGSGGRFIPGLAPPPPFRPPTREISDIIGISRSGHVWFLDRETGRVISEDVGSFGVLIARLGARGTVRTACALGERAITFIDDTRPGQLFVRDLESAAPARVLTTPPGAVDGATIPWTSLRFGGSAEGPCVLWAPWMRSMLLVSDSAVTTLGPFVEPLPAQAAPPARLAWYARLSSRRTRPAPTPPVGALDVTSFAGGVAVLFAGSSADSGRLIDLYAESGQYLETMLMPRRTLRIAGTGGRLIALEVRGDSVYIASRELPERVRARPVMAEREVRAPVLDLTMFRAAGNGDSMP